MTNNLRNPRAWLFSLSLSFIYSAGDCPFSKFVRERDWKVGRWRNPRKKTRALRNFKGASIFAVRAFLGTLKRWKIGKTCRDYGFRCGNRERVLVPISRSQILTHRCTKRSESPPTLLLAPGSPNQFEYSERLRHRDASVKRRGKRRNDDETRDGSDSIRFVNDQPSASNKAVT